jgi:hypothetical protein
MDAAVVVDQGSEMISESGAVDMDIRGLTKVVLDGGPQWLLGVQNELQGVERALALELNIAVSQDYSLVVSTSSFTFLWALQGMPSESLVGYDAIRSCEAIAVAFSHIMAANGNYEEIPDDEHPDRAGLLRQALRGQIGPALLPSSI